MTADLPAGAELDEMVAKAIGRSAQIVTFDILGPRCYADNRMFCPSEDIADAFAALEAMGKAWSIDGNMHSLGVYSCELWEWQDKQGYRASYAEAETLPLAISRAIAAAGRA